MDGKRGFTSQEREFELFCKETLCHFLVGIGEIEGLKFVAGGFDDFQIKIDGWKKIAALSQDDFRLSKGESAAAGGDMNCLLHPSKARCGRAGEPAVERSSSACALSRM